MNTLNDIINVLMTLNDNFIFPARVTIKSLTKNNKSVVNVFILHFNISDSNIKLLENDSTENVIIKCIRIYQNDFPNIKTYFGIPKESSIRLYAYKYLPKNIKKVIYLDADTIVLKSLLDFYSIDIEDYYFVAYDDQMIKPKEYERLKISKKYKYVCAGVMLMNIDLMRKPKYEQSIFDFLNTNSIELTYMEQDIINLVFGLHGMVKRIGFPYSYDRFVSNIKKNEISKQDIAILHYVGSHQKPWKGCACRHYHVWWKYAWQIKEYRKIYLTVFPKYLVNVIKKVLFKLTIFLKIEG